MSVDAALALHPDHLADLRRSGLSDATIAAASEMRQAAGGQPDPQLEDMVNQMLGEEPLPDPALFCRPRQWWRRVVWLFARQVRVLAWRLEESVEERGPRDDA